MQFNPILNPSKEINNKILKNIQKVIKHGRFILGPEVLELENSLKKVCKFKVLFGCFLRNRCFVNIFTKLKY